LPRLQWLPFVVQRLQRLPQQRLLLQLVLLEPLPRLLPSEPLLPSPLPWLQRLQWLPRWLQWRLPRRLRWCSRSGSG
jgi:hypothetical protein